MTKTVTGIVLGHEYGYDNSLCCPVCNYQCAHQVRYHIFNRPKGEDGESSVVTVDAFPSNGGVSNIPLSPQTNPSLRRCGIRINFVGECGHTWDMVIYQHKGYTIIENEF